MRKVTVGIVFTNISIGVKHVHAILGMDIVTALFSKETRKSLNSYFMSVYSKNLGAYKVELGQHSQLSPKSLRIWIAKLKNRK